MPSAYHPSSRWLLEDQLGKGDIRQRRHPTLGLGRRVSRHWREVAWGECDGGMRYNDSYASRYEGALLPGGRYKDTWSTSVYIITHCTLHITTTTTAPRLPHSSLDKPAHLDIFDIRHSTHSTFDTFDTPRHIFGQATTTPLNQPLYCFVHVHGVCTTTPGHHDSPLPIE